MSGDMHNENRCPFDIWAPDHRCSMNNKAFSAYAFRQQQIEDVINYLAAARDPDDFPTQLAAYDAAGLDSDTLTDDEIDYIVKEIRRRR
jgi:hypothetical protein